MTHKFRFWDAGRKMFEYHDLISLTGLSRPQDMVNQEVPCDQFTGQHAINGTEIYGEDFVRCYPVRPIMNDDGEVGKVIWVDELGGFVIATTNWIKVGDMGAYQRELLPLNVSKLKVIGNAHERKDMELTWKQFKPPTPQANI